MNKFKITFGVLLVFALGIVIGAMGDRVYLRSNYKSFANAPRPAIQGRILNRMKRRLDLSPEQVLAFRKFLVGAGSDMYRFRQEHKGQLDGIYARHITDLKKSLSREQYQEFTLMVSRARSWGSKPLPGQDPILLNGRPEKGAPLFGEDPMKLRDPLLGEGPDRRRGPLFRKGPGHRFSPDERDGEFKIDGSE